MQPFVIPERNLKPGKSHFSWHVDGTLFQEFENSEVLGADVQAEVDVLNDGSCVQVQGTLKGTVVVACDLCLENLTLTVDTSFEDEDVFDLTQDLYDFICTSLPMRRVHPEGECKAETVKYLSK